MDAELIHPDALSAQDRAAWVEARTSDARLGSPYFALGFLDAVAAVRRDTRVLRVRGEDGTVSFLPMQAGPFGHARALGGPLGDHHGLIGAPLDHDALSAALRGAGVSVYDHHGALGMQPGFTGLADGSWVCDLSQGFEALMRRRKKLGGNTARNIFAASRKLSEHGRLSFRFEDDRPEVLEQLFAWKSAQYRNSRFFDVFSVDWTRSLLRRLLASGPSADARGVLSSLEVDGRLVAVHFGLMDAQVMHYWFPAYDADWARQGPGNALLTHILEALATRGVTELHLGPGDFRTKEAMGCWQFPVVRGCVSGGGVVAAARAAAEAIERRAEALPLGRVSQWPGKAFRRIDVITAFRSV
jgi:CelD/BcsL family acetyltransferase involved in cellulose biosynthesis